MTYEELLEKARETYESEDTPHFFKAWLLANIIYPADESEDDRIRKELITHFRNTRCVTKEGAERIVKWIAWLEKQGEQKSSDFSDIRTWKYIVDMVLTEKDGIGNYLDNPDTEHIAKKLQGKFGNIEKQGEQTQLDYEHANIPQKDFAPIENKMLNADEVITWIRKYWPFKCWENFTFTADDAIEKFKKDFGL